MNLITENDLEDIVLALPGNGEAIFQYEKAQKVKSWAIFQEYLRDAKPSGIPYDAVSHNCLHFAREVIVEMNKKWAIDHPGEPPAAWGILTGDVPRDGDNRELGWHALIFCITEEGTFLGGAIDHEVMQRVRLSEIKAVQYMIIGGG